MPSTKTTDSDNNQPVAPETADTPALYGTPTAVPKVVTRVGNLTKDPEIKMSSSGTVFCRFRIASKQPKDGNWRNGRETVFYSVTCFDKLAENVAESVTKGTRVIVEGRAAVDEWVDKEGQIHVERQITANAVGTELRFATAVVTKVEYAPQTDVVLSPGEIPF